MPVTASLKEIEYFFEVYKDLEGKEMAMIGWEPVSHAHAVIRKATEAFR